LLKYLLITYECNLQKKNKISFNPNYNHENKLLNNLTNTYTNNVELKELYEILENYPEVLGSN